MASITITVIAEKSCEQKTPYASPACGLRENESRFPRVFRTETRGEPDPLKESSPAANKFTHCSGNEKYPGNHDRSGTGLPIDKKRLARRGERRCKNQNQCKSDKKLFCRVLTRLFQTHLGLISSRAKI